MVIWTVKRRKCQSIIVASMIDMEEARMNKFHYYADKNEIKSMHQA